MKRLSLHRGRIATAFLTIVFLAGASIALSACNTTAGFGHDVSNTGHAITHTANENK